MKKTILLLGLFFLGSVLLAGNIEKTFHFGKYKVNNVGLYQTVTFDNTKLSARLGEPILPYRAISLMLPPGEIATNIEISGENEIQIPGTFDLFPQQYSLPISKSSDGSFIKNESVYHFNGKYPASHAGSLSTQYMNGYAFALSTFTPMTYNPAAKTLSYFSKVTIRISTKPDPKSLKAMQRLTTSENALKRVRIFAQNPEMIAQYPEKDNSLTGYQYLVITPQQFANGFDSLLDFYAGNGIPGQVTTTEFIYSNIAGSDNQQKIRNYIKQEVAANNIEYVLLGGDVELIPYRGFYCIAYSSSVYEDYNIPADLYYSALDGEWNDTTLVGGSVSKWGEPGEDDLLPDVSVARCPFSNATELEHMVHKTLSYQKYPVVGELNQPYLVGEYLYPTPPTYGSDYMELLVDIHNDNGYYTHGIPSADNIITRLYDTPLYDWTSSELIAGINQGHSFIHHLGHANETYMMKLDISDITNQKFSQVDGVIHNYTLLYTQGCLDGSFDYLDCIAEKAVTITNFLVASVCNSRYGWFNQGTTDGPSQHLQREFVSALYNDTVENQIKEIGSAHMMSKIMTAPYVGLPGEFEPGAQRWVHYDCNVLGDPALLIWTDNPPQAPAKPTGVDSVNTNKVASSEFTTAGGQFADTYAWFIDPVAAGTISGTGTTGAVTWTTDYKGTASISVKSINTCGESEASEILTVLLYSTLGIGNNGEEIGINLYPNPNNGKFTLNLNSIGNHDVNIVIYSSTGVEVYSENDVKLSGKLTKNIDLSTLSSGFYFCKVATNSSNNVKKLTIVR